MRLYFLFLMVFPLALIGQSRRHYKEDKRICHLVEPYKTYYENGRVKSEGFHFVPTDSMGKQVEVIYDRYGNIVPYLYDSLNVEYYLNGTIKKLAEYKQGKLNGRYEEKYDNGQPIINLNYKEDKPDGLVIEWFPDGEMKQRAVYKDGLSDGVEMEWYDNGQIKSVVPYRNGRRDGKLTRYYQNGNLMLEAFYENDEEQGAHKLYYENGTPHAMYQFMDGTSALESYWTEDGEQTVKYGFGIRKGRDSLRNHIFEETYEEGYKNGPAKYFYLDGAIKESGYFSNNLEDGEWFFYQPDGTLTEKVIFKKGLRMTYPAGMTPVFPDRE